MEWDVSNLNAENPRAVTTLTADIQGTHLDADNPHGVGTLVYCGAVSAPEVGSGSHRVVPSSPRVDRSQR